MEEKRQQFLFRAVDQVMVDNIVDPIEVDSKKGFWLWGENNDYPQYLDGLYKEVATLRSIIEGTIDFVVGDKVEIDDVVWNEVVNDKGVTPEDLCRDLTRDYLKYGGFAVNVVRNKEGKVGGLYYIPLERLRFNEDRSEFYYSRDWSKSIGRVKFGVYKRFDPQGKDASSIYVYTNNRTDVYPSPKWAASVKAAEIERQVNDYHLNSIVNGFSASYLISLNNGVPSETEADEIEENMVEKFTGSGNGGRLVINFANDRDHSAELSKLETEDAGEKYKSLIERTKSELFTAFRATPNLFGLPTATGFSTEEYMEAFRLYNRTAVRPIQNILVRTVNYLIEKEMSIVPFSLDEKENNVEE
jgi:hypothetical protein